MLVYDFLTGLAASFLTRWLKRRSLRVGMGWAWTKYLQEIWQDEIEGNRGHLFLRRIISMLIHRAIAPETKLL